MANAPKIALIICCAVKEQFVSGIFLGCFHRRFFQKVYALKSGVRGLSSAQQSTEVGR
jgi:hypothetical protein